MTDNKQARWTAAQATNISHSLSGLWQGECTTISKERPKEASSFARQRLTHVVSACQPQIVVWKNVEIFFNLETTSIGTLHGKGSHFVSVARCAMRSSVSSKQAHS